MFTDGEVDPYQIDHLDSELIIMEVEKYPCLYNIKCPEYKDRAVKAEAWNNVYQEVVGAERWMSLTPEVQHAIGIEVQKRWKNMRDAYSRSIRDFQQSVKNGGSSLKRKRYVYHKQMAFLQDALELKSISGNTNESVDERSDEASGSPSTEAGKNTRLAKKRKPQDPYGKEILTVFSTKVKSSSVAQKDADEMFLMSLLPYMKEMASYDKLDFQIKTLQLIQSYDLGPVPDDATTSTAHW